LASLVSRYASRNFTRYLQHYFWRCFNSFSGLEIAFAHGGGSFPATIGRIEHGFNVRPDLCAIDNPHNPRNYLGQFWVDSLVHDENAFHLLQQTIGNEKICCGSDYPFPLGEHIPGALIESLDLADEVKQMMLFDNAMAWLA
jgi:aminocarboxymuconate-semialdehyde decarboxylase